MELSRIKYAVDLAISRASASKRATAEQAEEIADLLSRMFDAGEANAKSARYYVRSCELTYGMSESAAREMIAHMNSRLGA